VSEIQYRITPIKIQFWSIDLKDAGKSYRDPMPLLLEDLRKLQIVVLIVSKIIWKLPFPLYVSTKVYQYFQYFQILLNLNQKVEKYTFSVTLPYLLKSLEHQNYSETWAFCHR
jgi:hypothetical protein